MAKNAPHILILAAGQGKRMQSKLPKVLHPVLFQPMLHHVLDLAFKLPHSTVSVIVGHGEKEVREACGRYPRVEFIRQDKQLGTGHAVMCAEKRLTKQGGHVLILSGDVILLRLESMTEFLEEHFRSKASCSFITANLVDPSGYGRILRHQQGHVVGIREHGDASEDERGICEINSGIYCFEVEPLFRTLRNVGAANKQGEYYLTDVIEQFVLQKKKVIGEIFKDAAEIMGVNDRKQLAIAGEMMQKRINDELMKNGVTLQNPTNTYIDAHSKIAKDVVIESGCVVIDSSIGEGAYIEAGCRIVKSKLGKSTRLKQGTYIEESEVGNSCSVGPYAHLRPGSVLKDRVKIGNFVEVKKSFFADDSKASHLSYIGDAKIGKDVNLGCGFITCNYDGKKKHETVIEDGVFVGSDSQTVAPVKIGKGSYVASGTTVTEDVPRDSLVISRGKQVVKKGYAKKYRKKSL